MDKIEDIISLIKDEDLEFLGRLHKVDRYNTKLLGSYMFKGLMRLILMGKKTSLRLLEKLMNQGLYVHSKDNISVTFSGLSRRLKSLPVDYFKSIYEQVAAKGSEEFTKETKVNLHRFDSTIITLFGYLLKDGLNAGGSDTNSHLKVSIGLKNQLPTSLRFCEKQEEVSEDMALVRAINEAKIEKEDILLFDRGISKGKTFEDLSDREYKFVTRVNLSRKYETVRSLPTLHVHPEQAGILEDLIVHVFQRNTKQPLKTDLRLIKLKNKKGHEIWFLTNLFEMAALDVTELYRRRWDIEVFFKFIKQNLGYKHFISHSMNGMKVYIYMILITALMFLIYKMRNSLQGFKLALFDFTLALEKSFVRSIVLLSGGDLKKVEHIL
jgi:hypothetical protein